MTEKLEPQLEPIEKKQTRTFLEPIRFREDSISRVKNTQYNFNNKSFLFIPFNVSNDSHQKGLKLKIFRGTTEDNKINKKIFFIQYWFSGRPSKHKIGNYSQSFGVKECDEYLSKLHKTHTDNKTGYWIKDPNETAKNEKRIVEKPNTTLTAGKTINEVIEDYCKGGFEKDDKFGNRTSKSCQIWFRYMAGYNNRQTLIEFENNDSGSGVVKFVPNKHLRIIAPRDWQDLFRKYPPGRGVKKDRHYYNRRKKQTYTQDTLKLLRLANKVKI